MTEPAPKATGPDSVIEPPLLTGPVDDPTPASSVLPVPTDKLATRAARGAAIVFAGQGTRILIQLGSVVILAKILSPRDYGLLAMVTVMVGIGEVFRDFGLSAAAIQSKNLLRGQRDNLFWINAAIGLCLSVIAFSVSGLIAGFYREPLVGPIAQTLAVTFLINGLATQYRADLNRRMKFGKLVVVDITAQVLGLGLGVTAALAGLNYWALVVQQITAALATLILVAIAARWLPGRPNRTVPMAGLLRFGWNLVATQLIGYASNNIDSLIIGHRFGPTPLGVYNRAFQLIMTPLSQVRAPTTTVALPVLSQLQDDQPRFSNYIVRGQAALGYTLVAGLAMAAAVADPLVSIALGQRWEQVAPIMRILALAGIFQTLSYVGFWVYLARDLTKELFRYSMVSLAMRATSIFIGSHWGMMGVAVGYAVSPGLAWPISLWWLNRKTVIPIRALIVGALRILSMSLVAGGCGYLTTSLLVQHHLVALIAGALTVVAVYLTGFLVPPVRRDYLSVLDIARKVKRRKAAA